MITEEQTKEKKEEEKKFNLDNFFLHIKDYAEEHLNLVVLNVTEKVARSVSGIASVLVVSVLSVFALLFLSTALAWWIGQLAGTMAVGFLAVGGLYIIVALVFYANREKWVFTPVINAFLKLLAGDDDED